MHLTQASNRFGATGDPRSATRSMSLAMFLARYLRHVANVWDHVTLDLLLFTFPSALLRLGVLLDVQLGDCFYRQRLAILAPFPLWIMTE
jgi:hypothetical protein